MSIPSININFTTLANTFEERSYSGVLTLIVFANVSELTFKEYTSISTLTADKSDYSTGVYEQLLQAFDFEIIQLNIIQRPAEETLTNATFMLMNKIVGGVISLVTDTPSEFIELAIFAKENSDKYYTAVVFDTSADSKYVVNYNGTNVTYKDGTTTEALNYIVSVASIVASCSGQRACTYYTCNNLSNVTIEEVQTKAEKGEFRLFNDYDKVRVAAGVNSLQNLKDDESSDMKYIDIVDTMNLISHDISYMFKENYVGKIRNNYNNQMNFISDINDYFSALADSGKLDDEFNNFCYIDIESQRAEIIKTNSDATSWSDDEVKKYSVGRKLFLAADIKINGAMEHLTLNITMN